MQLNGTLYKSPLPGVTDSQWRRFAGLFQGSNVAEVSPCMHLGLYNIGYLRLKELGYATDVRQVVHQGRKVWFGNFVPPLTMRAFLSNPALQYRVFVEDMAGRAAGVQPYVGRKIDGLGATASGLLAVVKRAGGKGFLKWIDSASERERFQNTTRAFKLANGIF